MESWINLVPDCRKALAWLALYQNLFKKAFTCIYFLNKNSFFLVCPSLSLRCWLPLLACPTSAFYLSCYVFLKQYYSMHNADNDTILHLFLIKNKYVTLPLFAPSKIPTISYLKKKNTDVETGEPLLPRAALDRLLIENVIHCTVSQVSWQMAIWILKGIWIKFCFILKMNFLPSIMNPIYVLIFCALEACGSWLSPLTPDPNKEIGCFPILVSFFRRAETNSPLFQM